MSLTINNIKTFPLGGIHPAENKYTADKSIDKLETPKQVSIPITQHIGAPAKPVVEQREKVKVGQVIAKSAGFVSANIHATIAGTVAKFDKVMDSTGYKRDAIIIKAGKDEEEWDESIDLSHELVKDISLNREEIIKKIAEAGKTGPATVMITGLAVGMQSVAIPLLCICVIIGVSNHFADLYGVGIAAVGTTTS